VPSVASEALPPTFKSAAPPLPRPSQPADDSAPPSPFESMLDDAQQADAPPPPPPSQSTASSNTQNSGSTNSQPSQPPAASTDEKPVKTADANPAPAGKGKSDKAVTVVKTDPNSIDAKPADTKDDGDAKTDAKADTQVAAIDPSTPADTSKPADVNPVAAVLLAPTAPTAPVQMTADAATPAAPTVPVVAAAVAPAAAKIVAAPKAVPQTGAPKTDAQNKPQLSTEQADTDTTNDDTKVAAKGVTPAHGDGKPADSDDKQTAAPARANSDHVKFDAQLAANASSPTAAAKSDGDAAQQLAMNAPTQQAAPSTATAATAPAQQLAQQPMPQAVPLAGVGIEIASKALAGKNRFEIRLDPPELGRIEVRLDVSSDGRVTSHLTADRPDTLNLLQRDAAGLQRALQDAGLKTSDNSMQFSLRDQSQGQQQNSPGANTPQLVVDDETPIEALPSSYARLAGFGNGLDIRV